MLGEQNIQYSVISAVRDNSKKNNYKYVHTDNHNIFIILTEPKLLKDALK